MIVYFSTVHTAVHSIGNVKLMSTYFSFFPLEFQVRSLCSISYLHTAVLKTQKAELFIYLEILLYH